jgi:hypothetical protein
MRLRPSVVAEGGIWGEVTMNMITYEKPMVVLIILFGEKQ